MNIKEEIEKLTSEQEAIGQRAAAIKGELETANEETALKLKAELETLDVRSKEIPGEIESLEKKREEEAALLFKETQERELREKEERKTHMNHEEILKMRQEAGEKLMRGESVTIKTRDILISSTGITNPAKTENEVRPGFYAGYTLLDELDFIDAKGVTSVIIPIEGADPTAGNGTDGSAANNSDSVFKKATLTAQPINVVTYVSKHIASYTPTDFYDAVAKKAARAVRKKALDYVIAKLQTGAADDSTALYANVSATVTAFDANFLRSMALGYGGNEVIPGGAIIALSKQALIALGAVRGTNEKQALYKIEFDPEDDEMGTISEGGLSLRFYLSATLHDSTNSKDTAIVFKPKAFSLAQFEEVTVSVSRDEKFSQGLLSVLAESSIGGNMNCLNGSEFTII